MTIKVYVENSGSYVGELFEVLRGSISDSLEDIKIEYKVNFNHDLTADYVMIGLLEALRSHSYNINKIRKGFAGM